MRKGAAQARPREGPDPRLERREAAAPHTHGAQRTHEPLRTAPPEPGRTSAKVRLRVPYLDVGKGEPRPIPGRRPGTTYGAA